MPHIYLLIVYPLLTVFAIPKNRLFYPKILHFHR